MAVIADNVFGIDVSLLSTSYAWLGAIAYSIQIYFDFSGYSDIAIGSAKLFGINLTTNFKSPYLSSSIKEFWSRWHISLSTWLKDYIYIPLGGSRCSPSRHYLNLLITFFVSGLWHGANWTFILWGCIHGIWMVIHKIVGKYFTKIPAIISRVWTFALINLSWVYFRADSVEDANKVIRSLFLNPKR